MKNTNLIKKIISSSREFRTKKLTKVASLLLKFRITANIMTFFSLITGILAVFFLFKKHLLFILFSILHLIGDSLDGVLARVTLERKKENKTNVKNNHLLKKRLPNKKLSINNIFKKIKNNTKKESGFYFDYFSDRLISFLLLLKIYHFLKDYYVLIILLLFIFINIIYLITTFKTFPEEAPILYLRSLLLILLFFSLPTIAYLASGVIVLYTFSLQIIFLNKHLFLRK